jgi:archaellum biogenesis ATPase FlaH
MSTIINFLKEVYDVNTAIIPTFIEKDLQIIPTMIFEENEQATEEIIEGAKRKANNSRAVLIILQSIQEVEELREKIIDSGYDESKVFLYGTTNKELEYNVSQQTRDAAWRYYRLQPIWLAAALT